ncbi:MAG: hypothetical protein EOO56_20325 [Hymenobacter sp.]|nr:MAG: hypothetical protein EOO56_20325 [Hymenobacter sp.]
MKLFTTSSSMRSLALASMVLLGACSKKEDDATPAATATGVSWTADGTNYNSATANVAVQSTIMTITGISTASNSNNTISLFIPAAAGTYTTAGAPASANYLMSYNVGSTSTSTVYVASNLLSKGTGTVTVTTYSATEVIGTFSFTGDNQSGGTGSKIVTNGKFNIKR